MRIPRPRTRLLVPAVLAACMGVAGLADSGLASEPAFDATPGVPTASFARASLRVPLAAALARIESEVPVDAAIRGGERGAPDEGVRLDGSREPFRIRVAGDTLRLETRCRYWATVRGSRGTARFGSRKEPRLATIACAAVIRWNDAWQLDSEVSLLPVTHDDAGAGTSADAEAAARLDAGLASAWGRPLAAIVGVALREHTRLRQRAEAIWDAFQSPLEVGGYWIDYHPVRIVATPPAFAADSVRVDLALEARPVLTTTSVPTREPEALPGTALAAAGDTFMVAFACRVSLDTLAIGARAAVAAQFPTLGVTAVEAEGHGDTVDVVVTLRGGRALHMRGRADYDDARRLVLVRDLAYINGEPPPGGRPVAESLRRAIEGLLSKNISEQIANPVSVIGFSLNRPVTGEVRMSGVVHQRRLAALVAEGGTLVAHWLTVGTASLTLQ